MTFQALESSVDEGRPLVLYAFTFGSVVWRYTAADEDIEFGGHQWRAATISNDNIRQNGESAAEALTISAPSWVGPAMLFMSSAPSRDVLVSIIEKHEGDEEVLVVYSGEITQINFPLPGSCRISCETISSSMRREGLRLGWQRGCPYQVYDPVTCKLNKAAFAVAFTVVSVSGYQVVVTFASAVDDGYLNGGFVEWVHPIRGVEFLAIESNTTVAGQSVLTIFGDPGEIYPSATGSVHPGCDGTPDRCQEFGNYDNYGGNPDMTGKSPFDGIDKPVF